MADTILSSIEKANAAVLDSCSFELTDVCKELLKTDILAPKKIIKFMCQPDAHIYLREQVIQICEKDLDFDSSTFPVDDFVSEIAERFKQEVLENHELASYASYCMLHNTVSASSLYLANQ